MTAEITRRDFLNGVAIGAGAGLLLPGQLIAQPLRSEDGMQAVSDYYPPTLKRKE